MPLPVYLCATKYDTLAKTDPALHRIVLTSLRAAALEHGAAMFCFSRTDRVLLGHARAALAAAAFGSESKRVVLLDSSKPIVSPFGSDSAANIGAAPDAPGLPSGSSASDPEDSEPWVRAVDAIAPMTKEEEKAWREESKVRKGAGTSRASFEDEAARYPEPAVDALRL